MENTGYEHKIVYLIAMLVLLAASVSAYTGCGASYDLRTTLTVTNNQTETITNYAVPVVLNSSMVDYTTNKERLCFELADATELYYHISKYDWNTSGQTLAFVNVTSLPHGDTTIYLYSTNTTAANVSWFNPHKVFNFYDNFTYWFGSDGFNFSSDTAMLVGENGLYPAGAGNHLIVTNFSIPDNASVRYISRRSHNGSYTEGMWATVSGGYPIYVDADETLGLIENYMYQVLSKDSLLYLNVFFPVTASRYSSGGNTNTTYMWYPYTKNYTRTDGNVGPILAGGLHIYWTGTDFNLSYFSWYTHTEPEPYINWGGSSSGIDPITVTIYSPTATNYLNSTPLYNFTVFGTESTYNCWLIYEGSTTDLGVVSNDTFYSALLPTSQIGSHLVNITCQNSTANLSATRTFTEIVYSSLSNSYAATIYETATGQYGITATLNDLVMNVTYGLNISSSAMATKAGQVFYANLSQSVPIMAVNNTAIVHGWNMTVTYANGSSNFTAAVATGSQAIYFAYLSLNASLPATTYYEGEALPANGSIINFLSTANRSYYFTVNSTNVTYASLVSGNYSASVLAPSGLTTNGSYVLAGHYNLTFNGVNYVRDTGDFAFSLLPMNISNCSTGGFPVLLYLLRDEETDMLINGSQETTITLYNPTRTYSKNISLSNYTSPSLSVCLLTNNPLVADSIHYYTAPDYSVRYHYLINASLTPASGSQTVNLYLLNNSLSTAITIVVVNTNSQKQAGVFVVAERYYPELNVYKAVAMGKTNDNGLTTIFLRNLAPTYRYRVYKDLRLSKTTTASPIGCTTTPCELTITLGTGGLSDYLDWDSSIGFTCAYDNSTYILTCDFADTSQIGRTFTLVVSKTTMLRTTTVCERTLTASSGSLSCSDLNDTRYSWVFSFAASPPNVLDTGTIVNTILSDSGTVGLILGILLMTGIAFMALLMPNAFIAALFAVLGVIGLVAMNLIKLSTPTLVGIIVIGVIIALKTASSD